MLQIYRFARLARRMQVTGRWKDRVLDRLRGRPNTFQLLVDNTNRLGGDDLSIQPNVDNCPFAKPMGARACRAGAERVDQAAPAAL